LGNVDIHIYGIDAFRFACTYGHLLVAQCLYFLGDDMSIDVADSNSTFRAVCLNGRLEMAQWLYSLGAIETEVLQNCIEYPDEGLLKSWLISVLETDEDFPPPCF
jgi:hypothetical protein